VDELISFGDFCLDPAARQLRCRGVHRPLRAKSFAVLLYLARHPGRLITHDELRRAVWRDTAVTPTVVRVCIREIRGALAVAAQETLQTVPRRGYRFVTPESPGAACGSFFVGRSGELAALHDALVAARRGQRQIVFVSGEAGAGKTTLLDRFLDEVGAAGVVRVARGQCLDRHGGREPYGPVLDLLRRACDDGDGPAFHTALQRRAPAWSAQLDDTGDSAAAERLSEAQTARLLRELAEAIESIARDRPLLIALDDLHWSDDSTIDALSVLAQRTTPAQLMVVATYRPNEPHQTEQHICAALRRLRARRLCGGFALGRLNEDDVAQYLAKRLPGAPLTAGVAAEIQRRCAGHPLFLVTMVEHLLRRGSLHLVHGAWTIHEALDDVVPDAIGQLVASAMRDLPPDMRDVLEAASAVGGEFSTAIVAAASGLRSESVAAICERLAERRRLLRRGTEVWPDGTISERYEFAHALYADVIYGAMSSSARALLHRAIAARLEAAYGERTRDVAVPLARHHELGGDLGAALRYNVVAARTARKRVAPPEVIAHLQRAAALLRALPPHSGLQGKDLAPLLELAVMMIEVRGYTCGDLAAVLERARAFASAFDLPDLERMAVAGLYSHRALRADLTAAARDAELLLALARRARDPLFEVVAHAAVGTVLFSRGELDAAREALLRADTAWSADAPHLPMDECVLYSGVLALVLRVGGDESCAQTALRGMLARAEATAANPYNLAQAHTVAAQYHALGGDRDAALHHAEHGLAIAVEHGYPDHHATALVLKGWAENDIATLRAGLGRHAAHEHRLAATAFAALYAETLLNNGDTAAALRALDDAVALAASTGELRHLAELHRLRAACLGRGAAPSEAVRRAADALQEAIAVALAQNARLWEERARRDLAKLGGDRVASCS